LKLADYVVTESGFGADCGMEKFMNIKCRQSGLRPSCVVITCTIRALKMHGGLGTVVAGRSLPEALTRENLPALAGGCENLRHCIKIAKCFGVPVVVAVNRFTYDTDAEVQLVRQQALAAGAEEAVPITVWADGGAGGVELARAVVKACAQPAQFQLLYRDDQSIKEKIEILATKVYHAAGVHYEAAAEKKISMFEAYGWGNLPINMAKTHLSLSHDQSLKGLPRDYIFPIRDIRVALGAGFLYPLAGAMRTMPGLGTKPAAMNIDIDDEGKTTGLF
jgi:formyltetrahydrofolate synthetase